MRSRLSFTKELMDILRSFHRATGSVCVMLLLAGCATGPDFRSPAPPPDSGYTDAALPEFHPPGSTDVSQKVVKGIPIEAQWWHAFESSELDALVEEALRISPTLEAAEAVLRKAHYTYEARAGSTRYPQANASLSGGRKSTNNAAMGQAGNENTFNLYSATVYLRYDFDLFGGNRRALEALAAQIDYRRFQLEGARLNLVASIISTAIAQGSLSAQIETTDHILVLVGSESKFWLPIFGRGSAPDPGVFLGMELPGTHRGFQDTGGITRRHGLSRCSYTAIPGRLLSSRAVFRFAVRS